MPSPQAPQSVMSNPQLFAAMLQQMGASPQPNLGGAPMQQAGQPPQRPPMPPGAGGPAPMAQGVQPGSPPQQGPQQGQQVPPQLQQMLMQRMMQQQQQGQQRQPMQAGQNKFTPQELAGLGRMGDTTVAHLTPGEVAVPPQVQTPKVMSAIDSAFKAKHVDPRAFVAGSPQSSVNPKTGMPEYNFWSSFLPIAMGLGGGLIAGPIGAGIGDSLGGVMTGNSLGSSLMGGALTGLGDWGGGAVQNAMTGNASNIMGANGLGSSGAAPTSDLAGGGGGASGASGASAPQIDAGIPASSTQLPAAATPAPASSGMSGIFGTPGANLNALSQGNMPSNVNTGNLVGAAAGGGLGALLANSNTSATSSQLPSYMTQPYLNSNQLPSWQQMVGTGNYKGATPNFTGYNPATNYPAAFNFYPQANQPTTPVTTPVA